MKVSNKKIKELLNSYKQVALLGNISALLSWDMEVNLPAKAADARAQQLAYVTKLLTEKWNEPKFKSLIEETHETELNLEEQAILRNLRHAALFYYKVPKKAIIELSKTSSQAFLAWQKAKAENKFSVFLPHLTKIISLSRQIANHLGYKDNPYDALLDMYEPGLTTKEMRDIFATLTPQLTQLLKHIKSSSQYLAQSSKVVDYKYIQEDQEKLTHFVLKRMGYDFEAGRQDVSSHPFTTTLGAGDIRITNRYKSANFVESIMVAMHEGGHALYEQGVKKDYVNTPLDGGVSLGIHESQSRFWENQIGRSEEFVSFLYSTLQAFYPQQLGKIDLQEVIGQFNKVSPGLIRVEADEVTYNLHIALRFEIEESLINDKISVKDLPRVWESYMKKYLGVVPKNDREGVLQDVHWSHATFGYFPTYTLGNLYSAQFTSALKRTIKLEENVSQGNLEPILSWLRENIHQYGSLYYPQELVKKVTSEKLNPKYFLTYLRNKYAKMYDLNGKL